MKSSDDYFQKQLEQRRVERRRARLAEARIERQQEQTRVESRPRQLTEPASVRREPAPLPEADSAKLRQGRAPAPLPEAGSAKLRQGGAPKFGLPKPVLPPRRPPPAKAPRVTTIPPVRPKPGSGGTADRGKLLESDRKRLDMRLKSVRLASREAARREERAAARRVSMLSEQRSRRATTEESSPGRPTPRKTGAPVRPQPVWEIRRVQAKVPVGRAEAKPARPVESERLLGAPRVQRGPRLAPRDPLMPSVPDEEGTLPWLSVQDNLLVDENGFDVALRGVNVTGFDQLASASPQAVMDRLALDDANLSTLADLWSANLVRLPFTSRVFLSGSGSLSADEMLSNLDTVVEVLAEAGMYVLLAMEASGSAGGPPDADDHRCWTLLADRYHDQSAVLYEPFVPSAPLGPEWLNAAARLIGTIRAEHTASVLFVGDGSASMDVTGLPMRFTTGDPIHNLVYTIKVTTQSLASVDSGKLQALAQAHPVMASEWLNAKAADGRPADRATGLFERIGMHWAAANWNSEPRLVSDAQHHRFAATPFGALVQRATALPIRPQLRLYV